MERIDDTSTEIAPHRIVVFLTAPKRTVRVLIAEHRTEPQRGIRDYTKPHHVIQMIPGGAIAG